MECYPVQSEMSGTVKDILQNIEQASRMPVLVSEVPGGFFLRCGVSGRERGRGGGTGEDRNARKSCFPFPERFDLKTPEIRCFQPLFSLGTQGAGIVKAPRQGWLLSNSTRRRALSAR